MRISNRELIDDVKSRTLTVIKETEKLLEYPIELLSRKADENTWSALECFEHLNRYSQFYLPELENQISQSTSKGTEFKKWSTWELLCQIHVAKGEIEEDEDVQKYEWKRL